MTHSALLAAWEAVCIPQTQRTLGGEKAIVDIQERAEDWTVVVKLGFPVAHLEQELHEAMVQAMRSVGVAKPLRLSLQQHIVHHQVQRGVQTIKGVKNIVAVASGKGGVGKSTVTANLAVAMAKMGARVGVLDADLYGPSQPMMFGVADKKPKQENKKFIPVCADGNIQVMSMGFLVDVNQAVVWRGPMLSQALQQLLFQTEWDNVDYLFIDLPPGTGDIQLTLSQKIPVTGAVVVSTPQDIALIDAYKAIDMFKKVDIPILGVLENMSVHICSCCGHSEPIFGVDGGKRLAEQSSFPLLGQLPLALAVREAMDKGEVWALQQSQEQVARIYRHAAFQIALSIADKGRDYGSVFPKIVVA